MQDKAKGAQIRARAEWVGKGERSTSYFLRLENIRQNSAHITSLDERGDIVKNDKEILSTASNFYKKLYTTRRRKVDNIKRYVNKTNDVIKDLRLKKSPGLDG